MEIKKPLPYANKGDLTKGPVKQHLIRLTIPMIWGLFAIISFQLVDTYFIAQLPDTEQLAAISFTFPLTYLVFSLIMGFGIAMSSVASRLIGEGSIETVRCVTTHGLIFVFGLGIVLALIGIALHDPIFRLMGADEQMLPLIRDYMIIWFAGSVFVTTPLVGNAAIRATGDTVLPALIMITVAVVNIILDPLLIFGLWGFPRLELQGAAIATVFANGIAAIAGVYVLYVHKKLLCFGKALRHEAFLASVKRLLFIAIPAGLTNAIHPFVNAVILALLASHNIEAVAAFGVVTRIEAFAFIILMALSIGMAPIIGQNWGAGKFDRVHETLKLSISFNVAWSLLIAIVLGLLAKPIAELFSDDPAVIGYAALFFWIVPFSYAFSNLLIGWASAFNAMGLPQKSFLMIVVKMLVLMIPAVYLGNMLYDVKGIFFAIALVSIIAGTVFHVLNWRSCLAREKQIQEQPA
ncbi:MAG: MATE family efflux transporter [Micavibrio sp.]|nr:MAG: MATE family efflux transporter [Micavibrio sp.]